MQLKLIGNTFEYDLIHILNIFLEEEVVDVVSQLNEEQSYITAEIYKTGDDYKLFSVLFSNKGKFEEKAELTLNNQDVISTKKELKKILKSVLYKNLSKVYTSKSKWGTLVGIRPVKIVHELFDLNYEVDSIKQVLMDDYCVSVEKAQQAIAIAMRERDYLYPLDFRSISIYISIPFCPSRCLYCSFPSNNYAKKKNIIDYYIESLITEMKLVAKYINEKSMYVDCIYIGGGTPSVLSDEQIDRLCNALKMFDIINLKEFTFEAGRPNTITSNKLKVLKKHSVTRVCINPQTMQDQTLQVIGRDHTVRDIIEKYKLIKSFEFDSINMDLIIGLPKENYSDVVSTVDKILNLNPDNITIHTLTIKTASQLYSVMDEVSFSNVSEIEKAFNYSVDKIESSGYIPYYMYRQKRIAANLENIGFSKDAKESLYNMRIMEERHHILAFGAGASSKIFKENTTYFERIPNIKGVEQYIERSEEMATRKINAFNKMNRKLKS